MFCLCFSTLTLYPPPCYATSPPFHPQPFIPIQKFHDTHNPTTRPTTQSDGKQMTCCTPFQRIGHRAKDQQFKNDHQARGQQNSNRVNPKPTTLPFRPNMIPSPSRRNKHRAEDKTKRPSGERTQQKIKVGPAYTPPPLPVDPTPPPTPHPSEDNKSTF